ncbi:HD domain-containing protein [Methylococcus sp. EFPC2]|uniref:HD domain-containing protein n=1 Tax=Methylococcus sp. EFPC2 TaxID=2812648 RepID=UPI001967473A|nr:HD domain-containing protein [Methylococcus sp. EFPC2]QSA96785.1 BrnA antitoxin family protein [Methylococcus sp. EFPC2]
MEAYFRYWGKAGKAGDEGEGAPYHLLPYHSLDVAAVGAVLLERHTFLRSTLSHRLGWSEEALAAWITTLLSFHDLGKFAESFQQLKPDFRKSWWGESSLRHYDIRHDTLGFLGWHDAYHWRARRPATNGKSMKPEYDFSTVERGAVVEPTGRTRISIYLDGDILASFRARADAEGKGYQTLINAALRAAINPQTAPVTVETL